MTRSPLAYPLNRSADLDAGGAADLQTDIMRFMAILSLCLVAIFALVQSIPLQPTEPTESTEPAQQSQVTPAVSQEPVVAPAKPPRTVSKAPLEMPAAADVALTRPKWQPKYGTTRTVDTVTETPPPRTQSVATQSIPTKTETPPVKEEPQGFTLRFESDAALTKLVATNRIGLYAVADGRAQRMTVSDSRVSFWEASTPNTYHEMETATVPGAVIDALSRTGTTPGDVSWGVTLPGRLKTQLDDLMLEHRGGSLIIAASGDIRWETS